MVPCPQATARDLDDALSWKALDDGTFEVGVHIADVSYFMQPGTELDEIAARRSTTTYLVTHCHPMLPRLLCENLCSLAENVERLAFSVIWKFDKDLNIIDEWFGRTVIKSCVKLAYGNAKQVLDNPDIDWVEEAMPTVYGGHTPDTVKATILGLHSIARRMRSRRFANGSLRLDKVKVGFAMDNDTGLPSNIYPYQLSDANRLVEEFMLLANQRVARRIYDTAPDVALLRRHPEPEASIMAQIVNTCKAIGIALDASSSGSIHQSLQALRDSGQDSMYNALQMMLSLPMKNAEYFCTNEVDVEHFMHYALAMPFYTHFTSPIRRMADVVVHRVLAATLAGETVCYNSDEVHTQALICNERKMAAKKAQVCVSGPCTV